MTFTGMLIGRGSINILYIMYNMSIINNIIYILGRPLVVGEGKIY